MKNKELYERTVNILVDAYFNDTLRHGNCFYCAVGNIVRANGVQECDTASWGLLFFTDNESRHQEIDVDMLSDEFVMSSIRATGYEWKELAVIENVFELAPKGNNDDEYMFNGLMAVIEQLDIIHENTDTEVTNISKQRFINQPA